MVISCAFGNAIHASRAYCSSVFPPQSLRIFGARAAKLRLGPCASCPSAVDIGRIHDTASSSFRGHRDYANNGVTNSSTIVPISEPSSWVWNNDETRTTWTMMGSYSSLLSGGFGAVKLVSNPPIVAGFAQSTVRSMSSSSSSSSSNNVAERIEQFRNGKPTLAYAKTLPRTFAMMTNEQVLLFAEQGSEYFLLLSPFRYNIIVNLK